MCCHQLHAKNVGSHQPNTLYGKGRVIIRKHPGEVENRHHFARAGVNVLKLERTGTVQQARIGDQPSSSFTHFAPRLGIAYQTNPKTVVRIGYGRRYDIGVFGSIFGHTVTQNLPVLGEQDTEPGSGNTAFTLANGPTAFSTTNALTVNRLFGDNRQGTETLILRRTIAKTYICALMLSTTAGASAQQAAAPAAAQSSPATIPTLGNAESLMDQGKVDEAISALEDLARKSPNTPGLEAALGKAYYQKRDFQQAARHLEIAVKENPNDGESTQLLGLSYHLLNHVQQAIPLLEKVQLGLPRPDVTGSYLLGIDYLQSHQDDRARAAFARMFSVPPDGPQAHLVLAQMMFRQEFEEKAIPKIQKAIELDPRLPMAHFLLGEMFLFKSQVEPAIAEFQKELGLDPVLWLAYWRMGDAYTRVEKWDDAETALKQAA